MSAKNCFGTLLQKLIRQSGTKNANISRAVQYDISYISKWIGGKSLPSEKNADSLLSVIAECLVDAAPERNLQLMEAEYSCGTPELLKEELYRRLSEALGEDRRAELPAVDSFFPDMSLKDMAADISAHMGRRQTACIDLLALEHETRLLLAGIVNGHFADRAVDYGIRYDMGISLEGTETGDWVYDTIFLIHMLTNYSFMDFRLYALPEASGKLMFASDEGYGITGFLFSGMNGTAVSVCGGDRADTLFRRLDMRISQEQLIFRRSDMERMIASQEYIRSMISTEIRWIIGHPTEHILPEGLFYQLADCCGDMEAEELKKLHILLNSVISRPGTDIMIYESALSDIVVSGELDFFNRKVILNAAQRVAFLEHLYEEVDGERISLKIANGNFSTDFQYITNPSIFISENYCYVRLDNKRYADNILVLQDKRVKNMFERFYAAVWRNREDIVISDREKVRDRILHYITSARLLMQMEES